MTVIHVRALALSVFDSIQGPIAFQVNPPDALTGDQREQISKMMDIHDHEFFIHVVEGITAANRVFQIPSEAGRGHAETIQISILLDGERIDLPVIETMKDLLQKFETHCLEVPKLYCFLHANTPECEEKRQELAAYLQDFSEISQSAIKAAEQDEIRYQALFKSARDGILTLNYATAQFLDANKQAEKIVGRSLEEIRGKTPLEVEMHLEEEYAIIRAGIFQQINDPSVPPFEGIVRLPDNQFIPIEVSANKLRFWDQDILQCIFRDISERKHAEQLVQTRLRYESGIAECSRIFFRLSENALLETLQAILDATGADRVHIFKNFEDPVDGLCYQQFLEVRGPGVKSLQGLPGAQHISYAGAFSRWQDALTDGHAIMGNVRDFPPEEISVLQPLSVQSILVLPIFVQEKWGGFLGIDDTRAEREWTENDVCLLQVAAQMIGSYLVE